MIVCHCHGVSDRAIRAAVREGAATRAEVARACAAGACCGGCHPAIQGIIESELARAPLAALASAEPLAEPR
jgi:bacterioferritin-associated ferredoxin